MNKEYFINIVFCKELQNDLMNGGRIIAVFANQYLATILVKHPKGNYKTRGKDQTSYEYTLYKHAYKDGGSGMYASVEMNGNQTAVKRRAQRKHTDAWLELYRSKKTNK